MHVNLISDPPYSVQEAFFDREEPVVVVSPLEEPEFTERGEEGEEVGKEEERLPRLLRQLARLLADRISSE